MKSYIEFIKRTESPNNYLEQTLQDSLIKN